MSFLHKDKKQADQHDKDARELSEAQPDSDNAGNKVSEDEKSPEQVAGTESGPEGFPKHKDAEALKKESDKIREVSEEFAPKDGEALAPSADDAGSSPNSPSSMAAKDPHAARDEHGRFKRAVPDATGVSINGRPAHLHDHAKAARESMKREHAAPQVYEADNPASQVHGRGPRDELAARRENLSSTNKLVDNSPEIAKPQQVKDEQAIRSSGK